MKPAPQPRDACGMRVVFFGMEGAFSRAPLRALLAACEVRAVVVPRAAGGVGDAPVRTLAPPAPRPGAIPLLAAPQERTIVGLAWEAGVPVLEVERPGDVEALAALRALDADAICVACFPRLLPPSLLRLPRHGALNLHPSLLPAYRGPSPLFWIFHDGLEHAGVTVHVMDEGADSGDVVSQAPITLPDGIAYSEAERRCGEEGARLLVDAVRALAAGTMARTPQPCSGVPYARAPDADDFVITPAWSARRAFNFIRGIREWERTIVVAAGDERIVVDDAVSYSAVGTLPAPLQRAGRRARIWCSPGVLTVTTRGSAP